MFLKRIVILFFVFHSVSMMGQILPDADPIPKVFDETPYFDHFVKDSIRDVFLVNGHNKDTWFYKIYDIKGRVMYSVRYRKHKAKPDNDTTFYSFRDSLILAWWVPQNNISQSSKQIGLYTYDSYGKMLSYRMFYVFNKDTMSRSYSDYKYDDKERLSWAITNTNNYYHYKRIRYVYNLDSRLIRKDIMIGKDSAQYTRLMYAYNSEGLLSRYYECKIKNGNTDTVFSVVYQYSEGRLVSQQSCSNKWKDVEAKYYYNWMGRLQKITCVQDSIRVILTFKYNYNQERYTQIVGWKNTVDGFEGDYLLPSTLVPYDFTQNKSFSTSFRYNEKGHLIERRMGNNKTLYLISYY